MSHPFFKYALVKIQSGKSSRLTAGEYAAVEVLKPPKLSTASESGVSKQDYMSFADRVLKKARVETSLSDEYVDTRFLLST